MAAPSRRGVGAVGGASTEERTTKQLFGSVGAERRSARTMWAPAAAAGRGVRVARPPTCGVLHVALHVGASPRGARLPPAAYFLRRFDLALHGTMRALHCTAGSAELCRVCNISCPSSSCTPHCTARLTADAKGIRRSFEWNGLSPVWSTRDAHAKLSIRTAAATEPGDPSPACNTLLFVGAHCTALYGGAMPWPSDETPLGRATCAERWRRRRRRLLLC